MKKSLVLGSILVVGLSLTAHAGAVNKADLAWTDPTQGDCTISHFPTRTSSR
jgi:hypothetical protein